MAPCILYPSPYPSIPDQVWKHRTIFTENRLYRTPTIETQTGFENFGLHEFYQILKKFVLKFIFKSFGRYFQLIFNDFLNLNFDLKILTEIHRFFFLRPNRPTGPRKILIPVFKTLFPTHQSNRWRRPWMRAWRWPWRFWARSKLPHFRPPPPPFRLQQAPPLHPASFCRRRRFGGDGGIVDPPCLAYRIDQLIT